MNPYKKPLWTALLSLAVLSACTAAPESPASPSSSAAPSTEAAADNTAAAADMPGKAKYEDADLATDWSADNATAIALNGTNATVTGTGAKADNGTVTITAPGTYVLSGKLADGQVVVDVPNKGTVRLVLNGADIHNEDNAPVYVKEAGKAVITLQEGTDNVVSDGKTYVFPDASADEPNAAIFSKADLTVNGTGSLTVRGSFNNGITSKDDLKITGGAIRIEAADDGLMGRDLVAVRDGKLTIEAGGDGVKTTNDADAAKGSIAIEGGTFDIRAGGDGMQAANAIRIDGGTFAIVSGGGSAKAAPKAGDARQDPRNRGAAASAPAQAAADTPSAKALKAAANVAIANGTFSIDAADDAIHSNGAMTISGGGMKIVSGDDGIHADASIAITGGTIDIAKSYEGIESAQITIAGGDIRVTASDDGINIGGGNDGSSTGGRPGQNQFAASSANKLAIHGGTIAVNAAGDGLDSNGSIEMTGGTVVVNGPTANNNGALDYDGTFVMSGGFLIAAGSTGMASAPSADSGQNSVVMSFSKAQAAGSLIRLEDGQGNAVATFAPAKTYQSVVISSPSLKKDATYVLYTGGSASGSGTNGLYDGEYRDGTKVVEFKLANAVTWLTESGVDASGGAGRGGPGGGGPGMGGGRVRPGG
ncbi:carbohydrate-binding domain-containing protein [Paenibacillus flagellatus]|uniref:Dockerin type 1 n=1 Tax=Paenibacillus flagellatus TaxID=2211139 RepID=A0A2V5K7H6_9BACL|nr:carbohydrate-binding domain-containing protein [Paenibacillus flagellatus]PYI53743.1 hypothetical protein DLM86_14335 [Paenibacillus flagellatus]